MPRDNRVRSSKAPVAPLGKSNCRAHRVDRIVQLAFEVRGEVPQLINAVVDGEGPSAVFGNDAVTRRLLNAYDALETQPL